MKPAKASRRDFLSVVATTATLLAAPRLTLAQPAVLRAPDARWTSAIPVTEFAAADTGRPQSEALQAALDASLETGLPLVFPCGDWIVDRALEVRNVERRRRGFPRIYGAGIGSTRLIATAFAGPILSVRGAPLAPPAGSFFLWGGGIEGVEFVGHRNAPRQNGIEVLGWWHGTLRNCSFSQFRGHGVRAVGDVLLDPNPDWTASTLRVENCMFERLGGWGFLDDNPIGAPAWVFDHCVFNLCGEGGAFVRSSGHQFIGCSFASSGFLDETTPAPGQGIGLRIGDAAAQTINRTRVIIAEFDANKDAHILIDRATSFLIEDARFIHNDRFRTGRITPEVAVMLGTTHPRSVLANGRITRPLIRVDHGGVVTGYAMATQAASEITIDPESFSYNPADRGELIRTRGFPDGEQRKARRIVVAGDGL